MLDDVDIASMDYTALSALRERIDEKVREMREVSGYAPGGLCRVEEHGEPTVGFKAMGRNRQATRVRHEFNRR
jgi:hypothetical protein